MASAWNEGPVDAKVAVLLVDVDHFKRFNDTFGHVAGDACLVAVGQRVAASIGAGSAAVRYGGEEFLLFLPDCDVGPALALAELVCAHIRGLDLTLDHGGSARVPVSVGVAAGVVATTASDLIKSADAALYAAKEQGRHRVGMADPEDGLRSPLFRAA